MRAFFSGETMPVFLITVFSKGVRANLSKTEPNELKRVTKKIADECRAKVKLVNAADGYSSD